MIIHSEGARTPGISSVGVLPVTSERILIISLLCFILEGGKMQQRNS